MWPISSNMLWEVYWSGFATQDEKNKIALILKSQAWQFYQYAWTNSPGYNGYAFSLGDVAEDCNSPPYKHGPLYSAIPYVGKKGTYSSTKDAAGQVGGNNAWQYSMPVYASVMHGIYFETDASKRNAMFSHVYANASAQQNFACGYRYQSPVLRIIASITAADAGGVSSWVRQQKGL
jgi:hypothetical protein